MKISSLAKELRALFHGLDRAYGVYDLSRGKRDGKKLIGVPTTVAKPVTNELWVRHLNGKSGLGIIPIDDDSNVSFGVIDVDIFEGLDYAEIARKVNEFGLPLVPCRSKSGGVHLFAFIKEKIPAKLMREKLSEFSAALGYGGSEIFPKQTEILVERGDLGSWINMPYFNHASTERYGINEKGGAIDTEEFIARANSVRLTRRELKKAVVKTTDDLEDGPPCLQHLITYGFMRGTRNDGLFNLGVYLRKGRPDNWEESVEEFNVKYMDPPLTSVEVRNVVKSLKKKDYNYTCSRPPIKGHCNMNACRLRHFGVGQLSGMPTLTGLTKYDSQPPIWFLDIEDGGRIELTTADLQQQQRFQRRCMDTLNIMPPPVKLPQWQSIVQGLLENVIVIEAPVDASPVGQLLEHLEQFCTSRTQANDKAEVIIGKPWSENGRHHFRVSDFMVYLERRNFKEFKVAKVTAIFKEHGGEHHFWNVKGKGVNVWSIPEFAQQTESFDVPAFKEGDVF